MRTILFILLFLFTTSLSCKQKTAQEIALEKIKQDADSLFKTNPDERIKILTDSIKRYPENYNFYIERAGNYYNIDKITLALKDYDKAIVLASASKDTFVLHSLSDAYVGRADVYFSIQKKDQAIKDYTLAIEKRSDNDYAYFKRGIVKCKMGDKKNGCNDIRKAIEISPSEPYYLNEINKYCQ